MKVLIFGASSVTGKQLVKLALQAGHDITAFARDATKVDVTHAKLKVVAGDALNPTDVEAAMQGHEAVLSTLGPKGKPAVMAAESTKNIVTAMEKHGVKRIVLISVAGIAVPQDQRGFNPIAALIKLLVKDVFVDRENQLAVLESSGLEWTAVRVSRLTNDPPTGLVHAFFGNPSPTMKISRADLADFMVKQLTDIQWLRQAPMVKN